MAVFAIAVLFPGSVTVLGQPGNSTVHTGAPPAWVEIIEPDPTAAPQSNQEAGGQVFNLIDTQVNAGSEETYFHFVKEITTQTGVQSGANLEFNWDPSFQELVIHRIIVQRGTERMDRLDPSRFRIIQQETDLNRQIYNGALSAVLFLEDVRVGDRIEYDYTLRGRNPSLNGRYSDTSLMGWPMPVVWQRFRLLWPEGRQLNFALHGASFEPEVRHHDGVNEYIWDVHQEPAVVPEDQSPQAKISNNARAQRRALMEPIPSQIKATAKPPYTNKAGKSIVRLVAGTLGFWAFTNCPSNMNGTNMPDKAPSKMVSTPKATRPPERSL